jgi:hypothetical protein
MDGEEEEEIFWLRLDVVLPEPESGKDNVPGKR